MVRKYADNRCERILWTFVVLFSHLSIVCAALQSCQGKLEPGLPAASQRALSLVGPALWQAAYTVLCLEGAQVLPGASDPCGAKDTVSPPDRRRKPRAIGTGDTLNAASSTTPEIGACL